MSVSLKNENKNFVAGEVSSRKFKPSTIRWMKKNWEIKEKENEVNLARIETGELTQIAVGCDTGIRRSLSCTHGEKYVKRGISGWTDHCTVCDQGLRAVPVVNVCIPDGSGSGGVRFFVVAKQAETAIAEAVDAWNVKQAEKEKLKSEADLTREAIFEKARTTGTRQEVRRWSESCDGSEEECDVDNLVEYAMPDGTSKIERHHTW
jgi:hypothetical protein